jgi:hypothetical protein
MDTLTLQAAAFVRGELVPTLAALFLAAAREPLTWAVLGAAWVGRIVWRRLEQGA